MTTEERLLREVTVDKMRSRVTILHPSGGTDDYGNIIRKVLIVMRWRKDLKPESRFKVNGSVFKCLGTPVDACGRHKLTYMECVTEDTNL